MEFKSSVSNCSCFSAALLAFSNLAGIDALRAEKKVFSVLKKAFKRPLTHLLRLPSSNWGAVHPISCPKKKRGVKGGCGVGIVRDLTGVRPDDFLLGFFFCVVSVCGGDSSPPVMSMPKTSSSPPLSMALSSSPLELSVETKDGERSFLVSLTGKKKKKKAVIFLFP